MSLTIEVNERASPPVVALQGELDIATASELADAMEERLAGGDRLIVFDLSGLSFCDSAGLAVFVRFQRRLIEVDGRFVIAAPMPAVKRVLEVTGLHDLFGTYPTVEEAAGALAA
jgi:anti-anti-sigma factor